MVVHRRVVQIEPLEVVERRADDALGHGRLEAPTEVAHVQLIVAQQNVFLFGRQKVIQSLLCLKKKPTVLQQYALQSNSHIALTSISAPCLLMYSVFCVWRRLAISSFELNVQNLRCELTVYITMLRCAAHFYAAFI